MQDAHPITGVMKSKLGNMLIRLKKGDWYDLSIDEWQICKAAELLGLTSYIPPVKPPEPPITWEKMEAARIASKYHRDHYKLTPLGLVIVHGNQEQSLRSGQYRLPGELTFLQKLWNGVLQIVGRLKGLITIKI